jgi:hypothetical protein
MNSQQRSFLILAALVLIVIIVISGQSKPTSPSFSVSPGGSSSQTDSYTGIDCVAQAKAYSALVHDNYQFEYDECVAGVKAINADRGK